MKSKILIFAFVFMFAMSFTFLFFLPHSVDGTGANWLTGWTYRKSHVINALSGADVNYQMQFVINNASGADSGGTVYLNNLAKSDWSDIRFTASDGSTLLDAWNESQTNGVTLTCWVEISDNLTSASSTIYLYYGRSDASAYWDGGDTFLFFDDFNGTSVDTTLWDVYDPGSAVSVGGSRLHISTVNKAAQIISKTTFGAGDVAFMSKAILNGQGSGSSAELRAGFSDNSTTGNEATWLCYGSPSIDCGLNYKAGTGATSATSSHTLTSWYTWQVQWNSSNVEYYRGSSAYNVSTQVPIIPLSVWFRSREYPADLYAEYAVVRKWIYPEPGHSTWGTQEAIPTIGSPSVTWDDTDNCYAQKRNYAIQIVYTDGNGFASINVCELFLKTGANATRAEFAFVEDTNTFSTISGSTTWDMTGTNTSSGNDITITWNIKAQWDATEESDLDLLFFANDTAGLSVNSLSDQNFDVVTSLVTSNFAINDSHTDIAGGVTITGTVYYANNPASTTSSTSYPPDAEFTSVDIHDSVDTPIGTDTTIANGAFSASFNIPNIVQLNLYHAFLNMSDADYADADAIDGDSVAVIGDRIIIDTLGASDTHANIDDLVTFYATAELEYGGPHTLGSGDSLTLGGEVMTWDTVDSRFEHNESYAILGSKTINSFTSGTEATFGITIGNINSKTATAIWDALTTFNIQTPQYQGSGAFNYQAQIEWAYDNTTINGATVGVAYPNGTSIGSATSNSTGWATFILNQGNVTNGNFEIYGINDNNYTITVSYSNTTFTLYDWALNTKDIAGSAVSNTNLTVSKGATSVWSGAPSTLYVPTDTFAVSITWLQSLPVNTTASVTVSGATTTNFNCTIYSLTGTSYHYASNITISTNSYSSEILSLTFSGATSTYTLVIDKPAKPTYIINATYNYATHYTPYTYLVLPHYGNETLAVSYEGWGDLYIQKTTHKILTVTMASQVMSITATGTTGDIATLEVYCGTRGNPVTITGWITTTYSSTLKVLTGTLTFASNTTVTLTWVSSGSSGPGGTTPPQISPLIATVILTFPVRNTVGTTIDASVNITWSGVTVVTLQQIYIDSPTFATWLLLVPDGLPQQLTAMGNMGIASIPITLNIPTDVEAGTYTVPCIVTFGWQEGAGTKTFRTVSTLEIVLPPPSVPDLMTYWWLLMFAGLGVGMLVLRTRKRRKY